MSNLWAAEWRSRNKLDGESRHLLYTGRPPIPALFRTRRECRAYIEAQLGYIRVRPDLRAEPFGWRIPQAVRVKVEVLPTPSADPDRLMAWVEHLPDCGKATEFPWDCDCGLSAVLLADNPPLAARDLLQEAVDDSLSVLRASQRSRDERQKGAEPATARDIEPGPRERPKAAISLLPACGHDSVVLGCPDCEDGKW